MVVDLTNKNVSGKEAQSAFDKAGITANKNTVPFDPRKPFDPSGIRLGTPAITSRGLKEADMLHVANWIDAIVKSHSDETKLAAIKAEVANFMKAFPLYQELTYL